ncbi:MAG TPA: hypothetical protein DEB39_11455 [Planctomycetaceae bacterium]|nr:hypothetical protein [Planctomycetaceae bacterium]
MSYRNALDYLESKTKVFELYNQLGARVAICPEWNGRVMTSTADGIDGDSFGLIRVGDIEAGMSQGPYNFFGGEDQFTLSPEGGPFSLYYAVDPDESAIRKNQVAIPVGFTEDAFEVDRGTQGSSLRMRRTIRMRNLAGAQFDLDVFRTARLTADHELVAIFGDTVAAVLGQQDLSYVSYQTSTSIINRGAPIAKSSGLVSIRARSMFNSTANHVILVPFKPGEEERFGSAVCVDFFGMPPRGRLRILPEVALLCANGKYRCQIGVSRKRVLPYLGAVDFRNGVLTLVTFNLPQSPMEYEYLSNEYCETVSNTTCDFIRTREYYLEQMLANPSEETAPLYAGEVVRAYSNGPSGPNDRSTCPFYEFNTFSPAFELQRSEMISHHQYTTHINADRLTLEFLLRSLLNADFESVYQTMPM